MNQDVISFNNTINEYSINTIKTKILTQIENKRVADFFISLKDFKNSDIREIIYLVDEIEKFSIVKGISIGFIDYSEEVFHLLKKCTQNTGIQLYKNKDVAMLFKSIDVFKEDTKVLVYDEDEINSKKLYFNLCKHGFVIDRAQDMKEFLDGINSDTYDVVVSRTSLNERTVKAKESVKKLSLSKKLIINLPVFMNKAAETLVSFTGLEAQKKSHSIKKFDTTLEKDCICAVMPFNGDIEGFFTLIFPKKIAMVALEALLGEKINENDNATLTDGVGEFCNIITGSAKTEFDTKDIKVVFELPQTYISLDDTQKHIGTNNGVWMDMELSGEPFYMFITK